MEKITEPIKQARPGLAVINLPAQTALKPLIKLTHSLETSSRYFPTLLLYLAIISYSSLISLLHSIRLAHFMNGFDLAFYQQAIWNTTQGRLLEVSATDFSHSLLGTDCLFIYALLAPFYALVPSTLTPLVIETVVVALGALPLYWLAQNQLKNHWAALAISLIYLLLPAVQNGNLYELRERPMAGSFLLFAFYFWQKRRLVHFIGAACLALACRPENGLVLVMLGYYSWLEHRPTQLKLNWRFIFVPLLLGAGWFGVALFLIQVAANGQGYALGSTFAGGSPIAAIVTLVVNPTLGWHQLFPIPAIFWGKVLYLPLLLLPFAFLPLVSPRPLLMALPSLGLNLLAGEKRELQWNPFDYHYQASILPWCLVATIFGIEKLRQGRGSWLKLTGPKAATRLLGLMLFLTLSLNVTTNLITFQLPGLPQVKHGWGPILRSRYNPRWEAGKSLLSQVPDDAPLAITNLWATYLKPRRELWLFANRLLYSQHPTEEAQYVFADISNPGSEDAELVRHLQLEGNWQELGQDLGYILLKRKISPLPLSLNLPGTATRLNIPDKL